MLIDKSDWFQEVRNIYEHCFERHVDEQKWQTLADLDIDAVKQQAETLRPGHACMISDALRDHSIRPTECDEEMGINIHMPIDWDDGQEWLLRMPSLSDIPKPADMLAQVRLSEVCTYRFLHAAGVPVPEVYGWGTGSLSNKRGECKR